MRNRSVLALVALLIIGTVAISGFGTSGATAQDVALSADLVSGTCDAPGDSVGELRSLAEAEGGVLTSFTRVDIAIDDVTGSEHAVIVYADGDAAACGDVTGSGNDVYVPIASQSDAGYGGVAWLHARDAQTQISLFISNELGVSSAVDNNNDNPEPPEDNTPTPKATKTPKGGDETPAARATRTPRGGSDETPTAEAGTGSTEYEAPTFGFTFSYDDSWTVVDEGTNPGDSGPQDFIQLTNGTSIVLFYTNYADEDFPMDQVPDVLQGRLEGGQGVSNVAVRQDDGGDDIVGSDENTAFVAFTFTWTNDKNEEFDYYDFYRIYRLPGQGAILIFLNEGLDRSFNQQESARDALTDSLVIPE